MNNLDRALKKTERIVATSLARYRKKHATVKVCHSRRKALREWNETKAKITEALSSINRVIWEDDRGTKEKKTAELLRKKKGFVKELPLPKGSLKTLINMPCHTFFPSASGFTRLQNFFSNTGIVFVGQLVVKTEQELLKHRHMGKKTLLLMRAILRERGLDIGMNLGQGMMRNKLFRSLRDFLSGIPTERREAICSKLGWTGEDAATAFVTWRREELIAYYKLESADVDLIEQELKKIGYSLRPAHQKK